MDKSTLHHLIDVAAGRVPADLCLKNCRVVDVFNKLITRRFKELNPAILLVAALFVIKIILGRFA